MKRSTFSYLKTVIVITLFLSFTQVCFAGTWRDDFGEDTAREWTVYNITFFFHDPDLKTSEWEFDNNQAVGEIFGEWVASLWLTGEPTWQNYSISCRAKLVGGDNLPAIAFGLVLHAIVDREFVHQYLFYIETLSNTARITKSMGAPEDWSEKQFPFVAEVETWYLLSANVHDSGKLTFRIKNLDPDFNGNEEVFTTTFDNKPTEGGLAGLYVSAARVRFDDVEITGNNIPNHGPRESFHVEPHDKLATTWGKIKNK